MVRGRRYWESFGTLAGVVLLAGISFAGGAELPKVESVDVGCRSFGRCCQGKDNTCRGAGPRTNDPNSTFCFCDAACAHIGDCCTDHKDICEPVDCVLAENWDEWGECDARCGQGVKQRHRKIIKHPLNGGKPCESTVEKAVCDGTNCKVARASEGLEILREIGKIVPGTFGRHRNSSVYDPYKDIRKNLFDHYSGKDNRTSYCMNFELTEVHPSCHRDAELWSMVMKKGETACLECQPMAMKKKLGNRCSGHGVYQKETRWNAVTVSGCRGKWVMQNHAKACGCNLEDKLSFVLI